MVLVDESAPTFMARGMNSMVALSIDADKLRDVFRSNGAMSWGDHHPCLFHRDGVVLPSRVPHVSHLGVDPGARRCRSEAALGAQAPDIGCGHGASVVVMAQTYPASTIHGFDFHPASITTAQDAAQEAGSRPQPVRSRRRRGTREPTTSSASSTASTTWATRWGSPNIREHLAPGGTVLLVEPMALDGRAANIAENPLAPLLYTASSMICTPNSLSQEVALGLGAQAGEARLREIFDAAGYSQFRHGRDPVEHDPRSAGLTRRCSW